VKSCNRNAAEPESVFPGDVRASKRAGRASAIAGLTLQPFDVDNGTAKFDLTLTVTRRAGTAPALEYNLDLFERDTAARVLGHFQTLLESIVASPNQRLSDCRC